MSLSYLRQAIEAGDEDKLIRYVRLHFGDGDEEAGRVVRSRHARRRGVRPGRGRDARVLASRTPGNADRTGKGAPPGLRAFRQDGRLNRGAEPRPGRPSSSDEQGSSRPLPPQG